MGENKPRVQRESLLACGFLKSSIKIDPEYLPLQKESTTKSCTYLHIVYVAKTAMQESRVSLKASFKFHNTWNSNSDAFASVL